MPTRKGSRRKYGAAASRRLVTAIYLSISVLQSSPRAPSALCTWGSPNLAKAVFVDLDITTASHGKRVKLACESVNRIRPELIHFLVRACRYGGIAAAEVSAQDPGIVIFGQRSERVLRKLASQALMGCVHCTRLPMIATGCAPRPPCSSAPTASAPPIVSMRN